MARDEPSDELWFRGGDMFDGGLQGIDAGLDVPGFLHMCRDHAILSARQCIMDAYLLVALICSVYLAG
ncbi:MAG TPA: hypothetical protein VHV26_17025 [Rhizomicrobium sp.]|nr:hypothetical protein [Rhizomicrobium sp.]